MATFTPPLPPTLKEARHYIYPNQPVQWHLPRTTYDRSPCHGAPMGYLGNSRRCCMDTKCDKTWHSTVTGIGFVIEMFNIGEPMQLVKGVHVCKRCRGVGHQARTCDKQQSV